MAVSILNAASGIGDNNTCPVVPSAGSNRYWLVAVQVELSWTNIPTSITVAGDTPTTLDLITTATGGTFNSALYGCNDAAIGNNPSTANGGLTYNGGDTPASANIVVSSVVAQGVDQTTPFVNTVNQGFSSDSTNSTQNCPFTLDEILDGMGIAFVACSKTGTTWGLTDNGYAKNGDGQWTQGSNTSAECAVKAITADSTGVTTTLTTGLAGDKTSTLAVMLRPSVGGANVDPSQDANAPDTFVDADHSGTYDHSQNVSDTDALTFSANPALPAGFTLDGNTGVRSWACAQTAAGAPSIHQIIASDGMGGTDAVDEIVIGVAPSGASWITGQVASLTGLYTRPEYSQVAIGDTVYAYFSSGSGVFDPTNGALSEDEGILVLYLRDASDADITTAINTTPFTNNIPADTPDPTPDPEPPVTESPSGWVESLTLGL